MDLRRIAGVWSAVVVAAALAMPSSALAHSASAHGLRVAVKGLHAPCHAKYLVGTFTVSGLKHGAFQIDATSAGNILLHNAGAKKSRITLKHIKLKYQFPKGEPAPTGSFDVYVVQGQRHPSPVDTVTVGHCKA